MRRVIMVAPLLGAVLLAGAGCASDEPPADGATSPDSRPSATGSSPTTPGAADDTDPEAGLSAVAGSYTVSGRVARSDIDANPVGGTLEPRLLDLTCEDSECSTLLQRVEGSTSLSRTVRLTGTDRLTGAHTRVGKCPEGGDYAETFAWTWTQQGGDLAGRMVQEFKGCDLDGTTVNKLTAAFDGEPAVGGLSDVENTSLTTAIDEYDRVLAQFYDDYAACQEKEGTDADQSQACFTDAFVTWQPAVQGLAGTLDDTSAVATGVCKETLRTNRLKELARSLRRSADPNAGADERNATATLSGKVHEWLTNTARWCLPIESLSTMSAPYTFDIGAELPTTDAR